ECTRTADGGAFVLSRWQNEWEKYGATSASGVSALSLGMYPDGGWRSVCPVSLAERVGKIRRNLGEWGLG
ncbi:hypothetical protein R3X48_24235, partial [Salmonella enterica subsp. enterica serovar Typhimurium]|nr:hypothetical protein [Salmonella enterica subsp. enterica serovar Typhimurium]